VRPGAPAILALDVLDEDLDNVRFQMTRYLAFDTTCNRKT
jgi:hypothetical protein